MTDSHRHIFRPTTNFLIIFCKRLKTKALFLYQTSKSFSKHQFHHWFVYIMQKGITIIHWKTSVSQCRKFSKGNRSVLYFTIFPVAKNFMDKRGEYQDFPSKFFLSHTAEKLFSGIFFCFINSGYRKMWWIREVAGITFFPQNCFVSHYRNIS